MTNLSEIVQKIKDAMKVAESTPNEPEKRLRDLVSPIWINFLKERRIGLQLNIRDELTLANGRADTVFNKLILEYKKPHSINPNNEKNRKLISQVQGYILDLAKKERFNKERLLGVAFDGNYFLLMRYVNRWIVDEPRLISAESLEFFLKNLEKLTSKAALIPENLIRDFAIGKDSRNKVAVDCIKSFYFEICNHIDMEESKIHYFFEQWKEQFAEVHGSLDEKKIDKETLFMSYGFSKKEQVNFDVNVFFFALNSYYALLMKLLSYQVVGYYTMKELSGLPLNHWEELASEKLLQKCNELEEGGIFRSIGIRNFLEGDLFSWYTEVWNQNIYNSIKQIIRYLNDYDPETMEIAPDETRDILKKLYQKLIPSQIRHDLGEYYTPDWLAERCLNQINYNGNLNLRILDPSCGSGTFLILAIKRSKEFAIKNKIGQKEVLNRILYNIQGFDLNPLAVISSRTNYLLAIADLLKHKEGDITIPVYLCDSIYPPRARIAYEMELFPKKLPYEVKTSVGEFYFSHSIIDKRKIQQLINIMEDSVKEKANTANFLNQVQNLLKLSKEDYTESGLYLTDTYEKLLNLEIKGINGIWARVIKNAFAPLFSGNFDLVVGNPPWVNWESLPESYRKLTTHLWIDYQLFAEDGNMARQRSYQSKTDLSILMTYVAIDKYLKSEGKLCFVITQTIIKSERGGRGFRRFELPNKIGIKVIHFDDLSSFQPFEDASNRTAVILLEKGRNNDYPIPYSYWIKNSSKFSSDLVLKEVIESTSRKSFVALPINDQDRYSPWISGRRKALNAIQKVIGTSDYYKFTREGCNTRGANGVFWLERLSEDNSLFSNNPEFGRDVKNVPLISSKLEDEFLYPLVRGKDVKKWMVDSKLLILNLNDPNNPSSPLPIELLKQNYPFAYSFVSKFQEFLMKRPKFRNFNPSVGEYYGLYNIGKYSYSPYKVVWREQSAFVISTVCTNINSKPMIPDHKLIMVPFFDPDEAFYVSACLNSLIVAYTVKSYSIETSISTHLLKYIKIPIYDKKNAIHKEISSIGKNCHEKTSLEISVNDLEEHLDECSAELWGLDKSELQDIKLDLSDLK